MKHVWAINITPNESNLPTLYSSKVKPQQASFEEELTFAQKQGFELNIDSDRTSANWGENTKSGTAIELLRIYIR